MGSKPLQLQELEQFDWRKFVWSRSSEEQAQVQLIGVDVLEISTVAGKNVQDNKSFAKIRRNQIKHYTEN